MQHNDESRGAGPRGFCFFEERRALLEKVASGFSGEERDETNEQRRLRGQYAKTALKLLHGVLRRQALQIGDDVAALPGVEPQIGHVMMRSLKPLIDLTHGREVRFRDHHKRRSL